MNNSSAGQARSKDTGIIHGDGNEGSYSAVSHDEPADVLTEAPVGTVFTKKYDTIEEKLEALRGELDEGVANLASDADWHNFLNTMGEFHNYSLSNQMLIQIQCPGATRVAGFQKWKKEFERNVMKGEKGIVILAPRMIRKDVKDAAGKPVMVDGKATKRPQVIGFTTASVFDISQTDGKDLPSDLQGFSEEPPAGLAEDLTALIEDEGYTVEFKKLDGQMHGYTSPAEKKVVIDPQHSAGSQAKTLAHELGHIKAGHLDRTDEYHSGTGGCRGEMEVEAESIAYVVCRANGMSTEINRSSSTYLDSWTRNDKETIKRTAEHVAKTVKTLIGSGKFRNVAL